MSSNIIHVPLGADLLIAAKYRAQAGGLSLAGYVRGLLSADLGVADSIGAMGRPRKPWLVVDLESFGGGICSRHSTKEEAEANRGGRLVLSVEDFDARVHLLDSRK